MTLTHFSAVVLFSLFTSVVFGITQRSSPEDDDPLRRLLLRPLPRRHHRRELADVAGQALTRASPTHSQTECDSIQTRSTRIPRRVPFWAAPPQQHAISQSQFLGPRQLRLNR